MHSPAVPYKAPKKQLIQSQDPQLLMLRQVLLLLLDASFAMKITTLESF